MVTPDEELAGEQIDEGHRDHVAQHAQKVGGQHRQPHAQPNGDGPAQFDDGHHGDKEDQKIIFQHWLLLIL